MRQDSLTRQQGSVLLEALIAILIFSIGILALVGMQAGAMRSTTQSKARMEASLLANQRLGELWSDIPTKMVDGTNTTETLSELPNGTLNTNIVGDQVTVTVNWSMPGETEQNTYRTIARIVTN